MRPSRCVVGLFVALLAGSVVEPQDVSSPSIPAKPPAVIPPLPAGPAPDLDLVFTAQVAGYVEPCG